MFPLEPAPEFSANPTEVGGAAHFLNRLLHLTTDVVHLHDLRTQRILFVNARLTDLLGYTPDDLAALGHSLASRVVEPGPTDFVAFVAARFAGATDEEAVEYELQMRHKDGSLRRLRTRGIVFRRDAAGVPLEALGTTTDVTAEYATATRLHEGENLNRRLLQLLPDFITIYNTQTGQSRYVGRNLREELGYSDTDVAQQGGSLRFAAETERDLAEINRVATRVPTLAEGEFVGNRVNLRTKTGQRMVVQMRTTVFSRLADGRVGEVVAVLTDVTEERQASETLEKQTYLLREAEALLHFGSWEWDLTTDRIVWSDGLYRVLGYEADHRPAPLTPESLTRHHHPDEADDFTQRLQGIIAGKAPFDFERRSLTLDGREIYVREKGTVLTNERGEATKLIGSTADVTELKKSQTELEHRIAELDRSNRDLERFAYVASHDLHEPLRKITAFSERLRHKYADSLGSDGQLYLERIVDATQRMRVMMENLLSFSRLTRQAGAFEPTDLNAVLHGVLGDLDLQLVEKEARVEVGKLPTLEAIPGQMPQLLQNLIGNALKFAAPGTSPLVRIQSQHVSTADKIAHHLDLTRQYAQLTVEDNGIGFDPSFAEKIFVLFQRLHGRSEYEGTGIGLAICKKIVENHDGAIFAESQPNQGARFTVILPISQSTTERPNFIN